MPGLLLAGNFFVQRRAANGTLGAILGPINTTKLTLKNDADEKVRTSKKKDTYGQAAAVVTIAKPCEVEWGFDEVPAELMAMVLMGDVSVVNTGSGNLTDAAITLPTDQSWVELGHKNFATAAFVVQKDAAALTLGTDYEVNYALGLIRAVKGGAVETGGAVTVTAQYNAIAGTLIKGGIRAQTRLRIFGEGTNLETGKPVQVDVFDTSLTSKEAIDLAASEFVSSTLSGKAAIGPGKDSPYEYLEVDA